MRSRVRRKTGFSFVEVMTTVAVLSVGIVAIYQSFLKSLDYMNHMTNRLYVLNRIINTVEEVQKEFELTGKVASKPSGPVALSLGGRTINIQEDIALAPLDAAGSIYQVQVVVSWEESGRKITLSRSCYIYHDHSSPS